MYGGGGGGGGGVVAVQASHPSAPSRGAPHGGPGQGYIKVRDIGQGSYGKVALVQDVEGKLYVMKSIDMSNMDSKERRDAINEVRVLSCLQHPYIVSYRESFAENKMLAIVMDYAEGGDLYQRISRTRKAGQTLPERTILRWFTEASLALKYMHDKHVLHRDLKSQNLFLTASDRLRVGDFGISKVLENTAAFARTAIGTPYYLSPEICQEKPYSFSSDVWALGCVVFEMAALRVPFDAQNIKTLVQKITRGLMPQVPSNYSPELRQLIGDLLHRDQAQRPTASDIIQRRYLQDEIRRMLSEERAKAAPGGGGAGGGQSHPSGGQSQVSPGGAPSAVSTPGSGLVQPRKPTSYRSAYSPAHGPGDPAPPPLRGSVPPSAGGGVGGLGVGSVPTDRWPSERPLAAAPPVAAVAGGGGAALERWPSERPAVGGLFPSRAPSPLGARRY